LNFDAYSKYIKSIYPSKVASLRKSAQLSKKGQTSPKKSSDLNENHTDRFNRPYYIDFQALIYKLGEFDIVCKKKRSWMSVYMFLFICFWLGDHMEPVILEDQERAYLI